MPRSCHPFRKMWRRIIFRQQIPGVKSVNETSTNVESWNTTAYNGFTLFFSSFEYNDFINTCTNFLATPLTLPPLSYLSMHTRRSKCERACYGRLYVHVYIREYKMTFFTFLFITNFLIYFSGSCAIFSHTLHPPPFVFLQYNIRQGADIV